MYNSSNIRDLLKTFLVTCIIVVSCHMAYGQDLSEYVSTDEPAPIVMNKAFAGVYAGNGQSTTLIGKNELMMNISHRFGKINGGIYEMFGLDQATMRMGFDYGITPWLMAGFGRSTWEKNWDVHLKSRIVSQTNPGFPLTVAVHGQAGYNSVRNIFPSDKDNLAGRMSYTAQTLISRKFKRFSVQAAPIYLLTAYDPILADKADMFSVGLATSIKITKRMDIVAEYYAGIVKSDASIKNPLTFSLDLDTGGHLFQLVLSNSQGMFDKALLLNTTDSWSEGGIYFGFNLIRIFNL